MDLGSRLAIRAIVLGLRRSGLLGSHAALVINDELRSAAREAREALFDHEAEAIELLSVEIVADPIAGPAMQSPWEARRR